MKFISLFLLILWALPIMGQQFPKTYKYKSIGFNINAMNYLGELDPSPGIVSPGVKFTRYNIGLSASKKISPSFFVRLALSNGRIEGSDKENASYNQKDIHRKIRNLSFRNSIWEVKADLVKEIFSHRGKPIKRNDFSPYLFTGIAYFYHNPKARLPEELGGKWVALQPLVLEGKRYSLHQISVPAGFGFRYRLDQHWDFSFEMGWRFTFTDYLDDVSSVYLDRSYFGDDPVAVALYDRSMEGISNDHTLESFVNESQGYNHHGGYTTINGYGRAGDQRGDPGRKDWYLVTGFHFTYIIFKRLPCPKFRNY